MIVLVGPPKGIQRVAVKVQGSIGPWACVLLRWGLGSIRVMMKWKPLHGGHRCKNARDNREGLHDGFSGSGCRYEVEIIVFWFLFAVMLTSEDVERTPRPDFIYSSWQEDDRVFEPVEAFK